MQPENKAMKELWRRQRIVVQELLFDEWDPIGVSKIPDWNTEEYHTYGDKAISMAREGQTAVDIADYLTAIARDHICMPVPYSKNLYVSKKILNAIKSQG